MGKVAFLLLGGLLFLFQGTSAARMNNRRFGIGPKPPLNLGDETAYTTGETMMGCGYRLLGVAMIGGAIFEGIRLWIA